MDPDPSHTPLALFFQISTSTEIILIGGFLILLLCSALISGAEVAFFALEPSDFKNEAPPKREKIILGLLDRPKKLLATILIANNAINISIVLIFDILGSIWFANLDNTIIRWVFEIVIVTFLILFFGEILPKVYASRNRVKFSDAMALPLSVLDKAFSFISLPMRYVTVKLHERLGNRKSSLTVSHLSQALELTDQEDTTEEEQQLLQGIVNFGNTDVKNIMRNRTDVFALDASLPFSEIIPLISDKGFSRIPVYSESMDQIEGVLYVKDLLPYLNRKNYEWNKLLRETYFVPENRKLDDLLRDFQEQKKHLAIVVDEYGGTSGLITLQDIIEEIVGDISDEFDDEDVVYSQLDARTFIFEGKTSLKDFYKIVKMEDEAQEAFENRRGESETMAGFLLEQTGTFPRKLEQIQFDSYFFVIEAVDKRRIKQIKCTIPE